MTTLSDGCNVMATASCRVLPFLKLPAERIGWNRLEVMRDVATQTGYNGQRAPSNLSAGDTEIRFAPVRKDPGP